MRVKVPDYYKSFKCIASECKDTCCAGWEVDVDETAADYYNSATGEFAQRVRQSMITDEDGIRFKLTDDRRCCFLNDCNLCDLYTAMGEEHLCDTCTDFPRFSEEFGDIREKGISLSCPTAAGLILNHNEALTFEEEETDELVGINDIEYDLYIRLISARKLIYNILMNRDMSIDDRIIGVLVLANNIQRSIDKQRYKKIDKLLIKCSDRKYLDKLIYKFIKKSRKHVDGLACIKELFLIYKDFEIINDNWPDILDNVINTLGAEAEGYDAYYSSRAIQYEQLMLYFIYRYFMKAVYDYDVIAKVKLAVASVIMIKNIDKACYLSNRDFSLEDFIWMAHLYSKEIEHSDYNMDSLEKLCHENMVFHMEALIAMLME